ncbi:MAG TPA: CBS domain-containing protein [Gemmatimonadaceae bacterium]|jgi:CBS domain-containing protein
MLKVRDIMTRDVVTLSPDLTLEQASGVFAQKHISGAPVIASGRVVGVVSQSDILDFAASAAVAPAEPAPIEIRVPEEESERLPLPTWEDVGNTPARFFADSWTELPDEAAAAQLIESEPYGERADYESSVLGAHTVDEVMTRALRSVQPDAEVSEAADYMRRVGIHRVLVMEGEELLGILTALDLAKAVADHRLENRVYVFGRHADDRGEEP